MGVSVDQIMAEALGLSPEARAFLAEKLIESLDADRGAELSPAWRDEVRRRCREIDENLVQLRDAEDVMDKAGSLLR